MKNLFYSCIIIGLCLSGCKKDKDNTGSGTGPSTVGSQECLMLSVKYKVVGDTSDWKYHYDTQRRLILITKEGSQQKTSYTYSDDKMIVEDLVDWGNGDTSTIVTTNYLNADGFISRAVEDDGTQTLYSYNEDGYLVRKLIKEEVGGYLYGYSYEYADGNRMSSHRLRVDTQTGETISSTLEVSCTYYDKLPGKMEAVMAWINREGRGSKNELKSMDRGGSVVTYEYLIGSNGMPKSMNQMASGTIILRSDMAWECH